MKFEIAAQSENAFLPGERKHIVTWFGMYLGEMREWGNVKFVKKHYRSDLVWTTESDSHEFVITFHEEKQNVLYLETNVTMTTAVTKAFNLMAKKLGSVLTKQVEETNDRRTSNNRKPRREYTGAGI